MELIEPAIFRPPAARAPRVSVISIFYNAEEHIAEAIESVLAQSFEGFELLLVDDGSTDGSTAIARDYAARFPDRVRYLEHEGHANRGMSAARNLGVREARGDHVAFIDSDDRWRSPKLEEQIALLDRMPNVDVVGGAVNYWASGQGGKDRVLATGHVRNRPIPPGEAALKLYPLGRAHAPSMSDLMFRRSAIQKVGGFEEQFTGAYEDQAFLAKIYLASTLHFSDHVWSDYRLHPNSCMAKVNRDGTYGDVRNAFLSWFEGYLASTPFRDDPNIRRTLKRSLKRYRPAEVRSVRKVLADSVVGDLFRGAKRAVRRLEPILAPGPAILMYHRIAEEGFDPWGLAVSPRNFADQLGWIKRNRTILSLSHFVELRRQGRLPRNAIALTFDDGYACNAEVAVPLLSDHGIPATIFLPSELIERGNEFWWDELERIVRNSEAGVLNLGGQEIVLGKACRADRIWPAAKEPRTARQRAYHRLWSLLYGLPAAELDAGINELRKQARQTGEPRQSHRPMSPAEIRGIRSPTIEFGAHALSHASLPSLSTESKAREIAQSMERCTELSGARPASFAYPYGNLDRESAELVEKAGFACAVKADGRFVSRRSNRFALPRLFVGNWDRNQLARELGRP